MNFFDLHADTPYVLDILTESHSIVDIKTYPFNFYNQVMAVFIKDDENNPFELYRRRLNLIRNYLFKNKFSFLKNMPPYKSGAYLSIENAGFLAKNLNQIYKLFDDGVCMLSLTWNGDNELASGAMGSGGISSKGKDLIKIMNELGIALDISHLSHKAAMQGIELADKVLATHSCIYDLLPNKRNIKTETINYLAQKQGIIGICFYPLFLGSDDVFQKIIYSVEYLLNLGFEKNISFGSDFDGADMSSSLSSTKHIPKLYEAFIDNGFKNSTIENIFYKNAIAFFNKICKNK